MKLTGSKIQRGQIGISVLGSDRLTMILVTLALFLTAAIAALGVDLWLWPASQNTAALASAPRELPRLAAPAQAEPVRSASPTPASLPAAVRIRIPAIGVDRSIIEVPLTYDSRSGTWERDYSQLFRQGGSDLVGHYGGSASPGQPGNMILVGHNYGYGVNGVFVRLGRLKAGHQVEVVNATGQTFTYRVTEVTEVRWIRRTEQDLLKHQSYLSFGGTERLTLVTCGGSKWAPFPDRVYVVAEPVP